MQLAHPSHCLIHRPDGDSFDSQSGIIFSKKFVLTHARILQTYLKGSEVKDHLKPRLDQLKSTLRFQVIVDTNDDHSLQALQGKFVHIFKCPNVENFVRKQLIASGADDTAKHLLASFIILSVENDASGAEDWVKFFRNFWLEQRKHPVLKRGDPVLSISTPFGNECFFGTLNYGHISNIAGQDNCLLLLDIPLVYGAVGAGLFTPAFEWVGLVISQHSEWQRKKIDLAMAVSLSEIFTALTGSTPSVKLYHRVPRESNIEDRVVLVQSGNSWATGCLVRVNNLRLILTCSHAIQNSQLECIWQQQTLRTKLIFQNRHQVFDLAVVSVHTNIPDKFFSTMSDAVPVLGQRVRSVGFPVRDHNTSIGPFISSGRVTKVKKGIFFTDASIRDGQSGSPFYDENGQVLGIVVANAQNQETRDIFQKVNMAIPSSEFLNILEEFAATNDGRVLEKLATNDNVVTNHWKMEMPLILSKL